VYVDTVVPPSSTSPLSSFVPPALAAPERSIATLAAVAHAETPYLRRPCAGAKDFFAFALPGLGGPTEALTPQSPRDDTAVAIAKTRKWIAT
jgi:hypothetical protein